MSEMSPHPSLPWVVLTQVQLCASIAVDGDARLWTGIIKMTPTVTSAGFCIHFISMKKALNYLISHSVGLVDNQDAQMLCKHTIKGVFHGMSPL